MARTWVTALLVAGIVLGCSTEGPVQPQATVAGTSFAGGSDKPPRKLTFTDVTLVDGDGAVFANAIIEASVGDRGGTKNDITTCSYFTESWAESLGYYEELGFISADPAEVQAFCEEEFRNRH